MKIRVKLKQNKEAIKHTRQVSDNFITLKFLKNKIVEEKKISTTSS